MNAELTPLGVGFTPDSDRCATPTAGRAYILNRNFFVSMKYLINIARLNLSTNHESEPWPAFWKHFRKAAFATKN